MKYVCSAGHKFIHPAVRTIYDEGASKISSIEMPVPFTVYHQCPVCRTIDYDEYVEPQADIVSVKSVDLSEVDDYLKQGYIIECLYAKTATLKKLAEVKKE